MYSKKQLWKSVSLLSGNDLQNEYIQISSKNISFFSATRPENPSLDLQADSFLVSHFSWIVIKFLKTICVKGPVHLQTLQTEYMDFGKRWGNTNKSGNFPSFYRFSGDDKRIFMGQIANQQQQKGKRSVVWSHAQCIRTCYPINVQWDVCFKERRLRAEQREEIQLFLSVDCWGFHVS